MKETVIKELVEATKLEKSQVERLIETPPSPELGDFAFPCFVLAKEHKKSPHEIAKSFAHKIENKEFEKVVAVGPYINFFINKKKIAEQTLKEILKEKNKYGSSKMGKKEKIMVEFSQANTHKAFHVGHIRGTSLGESISRILEFLNYKAIRANYQGDTGMHVAKWIWCYKKFHSGEKLIGDESWIASIYVDAVKRLETNPGLQDEVNVINQQLELGKDKELTALWKKTRDLSLKAFEKIYKELNTKFDKYYFEREVEKRGKEIALDLVKRQIAKVSDGAAIINLEEFNLGVWVLLRKDGTVLYSAKDLALAEKKFKDYNLTRSITATGAAQALHTAQIRKTLELMHFSEVKKYDFINYAEVRLPTGKMSSRTGDNILYSDFMKEITEYAASEIEKREKLDKKELQERALKISISAIKYAMLKQSSNSLMIFNKEEAVNFEGNTGPYLLYTYARARSILRKANYKKQSKISVNNITDKEKNLIIQLNSFTEQVSHAKDNLAPNIIANYAFKIAQLFNEYYHSEQVIGSKEEEFRLALVDCFCQVLNNALNLLGIEAIEKM